MGLINPRSKVQVLPPAQTRQYLIACYGTAMTFLAILLMISSALWCASAVFLIYASGMALLTFDIPMFLTSVIFVILANIMQFTLAILNDG
jgi:hypothetical protein